MNFQKYERFQDKCARLSALRGWRSVAMALCGAFAAVTAALLTPPPAMAQEAEAMSLTEPPLNITTFIRSRPNRCYDDGSNAAMRLLAEREVERINSRGGVYGRPIALRMIEERSFGENPRDSDEIKAGKQAARDVVYAGVRETLADPDSLAMVGLSSSSSADRLFGDLGQEIDAAGMPFITNVSVSSVFKDNPTAFSTVPAQEVERGPVVAAFMRSRGYKRIAMIVRDEVIWSRSMAEAVRAGVDRRRLVGDYSVIRTQDGGLDPERLTEIAEDLKRKKPDMVMIAVGTSRTAPVIEALSELKTALFVIGSLETLQPDIDPNYPNPIYGLGWDRLPEIYNERLRELVSTGAPGDWIFEGAKQPSAPGWAEGTCEERSEVAAEFRDPLDRANERAIQRASVMADMIRLAATAAMEAGPEATSAKRRAAVVNALSSAYTNGRRVFRGSYSNWWFNPEARVASQTPFILILPSKLGRIQLAPTQFVRTRSGELKPIETLYVDVDLIRAFQVDENERTFFAEFYLAMRSTKTASVDRLEFTNAYLDPRTNGRLLSIEELHGGGPSDAYPSSMKIYKVSGRFMFEPTLDKYPFDTQRFAIDIRPSTNGGGPFIVQPPPPDLRDQDVDSDDWAVSEAFVSVDTDFVPVVDAFTHDPSVVPFYTASYVWMMDRETTDYFLRVVVPLGFILIVAYLSIFIPLTHFEAIVTIQVTALLSAVALYLSLPQLDSDSATVSDRIFLFDYLLISVMIGLSILRITERVSKRRWLRALLAFFHIISIPAAVAAAVYFIRDDWSVLTG